MAESYVVSNNILTHTKDEQSWLVGQNTVTFDPAFADTAYTLDVDAADIQVLLVSKALGSAAVIECSGSTSIGTVLAQGLASDEVIAVDDNAIDTVANIKAHLGIAASDSTKDSWLAKAVNECSSFIENTCNAKFKEQNILDETHKGEGWNRLFPKWNISNFYSADWSEDFLKKTDPLAAWEKIEATKEYITFDPNERSYFELYQEAFDYGFGFQNIKISYKAGFATIPGEIKALLADMVQMRYNESKQGNDWLGRESHSMSAGGSGSWSYKDLKPEWIKIMNCYRRAML